jgi:UDP-2-acetamido-3-amino-2,3-dideoxy-glucuronate N-acetyltransferase
VSAIDPTATVDDGAEIGARTRIWQLAHVRTDAIIGADCIVGRGAYIGAGVVVGDRCKIQNYALVYEPAELGDGVFIGPAAVLTNDQYPRAIAPDGSLKSADDWAAVGVTVGRGASIGAQAVCVAPLEIGEWASVAAGAVVARNVPAYALVAGVPAKRVGWVGPSGLPLTPLGDGLWECPQDGSRFSESQGQLSVERSVPDA